MTLDVNILFNGIKEAFSLGIVSPPFNANLDDIAIAISEAYNDYAMMAQSCGLLTPTIVYLDRLKNGMKQTLGSSNTIQQAAEQWSQSFYDYWDNALFGSTGIVTSITGKNALYLSLIDIFNNTSNSLESAAYQISNKLDEFTKTVLVTDTFLPNPPGTGCGPSPIF